MEAASCTAVTWRPPALFVTLLLASFGQQLDGPSATSVAPQLTFKLVEWTMELHSCQQKLKNSMFCLVIDLPPDLLPKIYCISTHQGQAKLICIDGTCKLHSTVFVLQLDLLTSSVKPGRIILVYKSSTMKAVFLVNWKERQAVKGELNVSFSLLSSHMGANYAQRF